MDEVWPSRAVEYYAVVKRDHGGASHEHNGESKKPAKKQVYHVLPSRQRSNRGKLAVGARGEGGVASGEKGAGRQEVHLSALNIWDASSEVFILNEKWER